MATDLAEFIGAAIGFKLILGVSLLQGAVLTGIATFLILMLQRRGQKPLEKSSAVYCFLSPLLTLWSCFSLSLIWRSSEKEWLSRRYRTRKPYS